MSFPVTKSKRIVLQNELLVIVLHPIEQILQALKLYEIIGHTQGLEWTLSRSMRLTHLVKVFHRKKTILYEKLKPCALSSRF